MKIAVANMLVLYAYILSLLYVVVSIGFCNILKKYTSEFFIRKILHILMTNWWYIRLCFLDCRLLWIGPLVFMFLTIFYARKNAIKSGMEYFCFSLTLMTFLTEVSSSFLLPATVAVFTMGYADSAAALVGNAYQKSKNMNKPYSVIGSITFFVVSTTVFLIFLSRTVNVIFLFIISAIVTLIEAKLMPKYDNITVPISTYFMILFVLFVN